MTGATPYPGTPLRLRTPWMTGRAVTHVQDALELNGFLHGTGRRSGGDVPGAYGTRTARAVRAFQHRQGLAPDGVVGPRTWDALFGGVDGSAGQNLPLPPPALPSPPPAPAVAPQPHAAADTSTRSGPDSFGPALRFVLRWEGGFVDDPSDPGGRTNKGITWRVYDTWRRRNGLPHRDVKDITDDEVAAIYRHDYWIAAGCDQLAPPVDLLQFDTAVNMGVGRAASFLQAARANGHGRGTTDWKAMAVAYCAAREHFYRQLGGRPNLAKFLKGWLRRLDALRRAAGLPTTESVDDDDDSPVTTPRVPPDEVLNPVVGTAAQPVPTVASDGALQPLIDDAIAKAAEPDAKALAGAMEALFSTVGERHLVPTEYAALQLLSALRRHRRFAVMRDTAQRFQTIGLNGCRLVLEYGRALVECEELVASAALLASMPQAEVDVAGLATERSGLLGRVWKQRFLAAGRDQPTRAAALRLAAAWYQTCLASSPPSERAWPAINLVALVMRARREGLDPGTKLDPTVYATDVLGLAHDGQDYSPWYLATFAEASVALGAWAEAETWTRSFITHPETDVFMLGATLRQFTQIWGLGADGRPGGDLVAALRTEVLRREGSSLLLSSSDIQALAATPAVALQRVLGEQGTVTWSWMQMGLARAAAVGLVRRPDGRGVGTGFLVRGGDLDPALGDEALLLTNAHVLSDDPRDTAAVSSTDASISFDAALGSPAFRIGGVVWSSSVLELDACLVRLDPSPAIVPCPLYDGPLPRPPAVAENQPPRLYIIGHPRGGTLTYSLEDNALLDHEGPPEGQPGVPGRVLLHYRTPTEPGSSGSPVFDAVGWRVVALHHAGGTTMRRLNGAPGTYAANEGIWIQSIRTGLLAAARPAPAAAAAPAWAPVSPA